MTNIYGLQDVPNVVGSAHLYRQALATFASSLLSLSGGITFGYTSVLLPQLEQDSSFPYDKTFDSWIASISPFAMMIGCLFSGIMSDAIGRRMGQIVLIGPFTLGWIIMGFAHNNIAILIGRFITGLCTGAVRPNSMVYIGELTDPKYRAIASFVPSLNIHIGSLLSHVVGKYVYWKYSCFIFILPNIISIVLLLCLKESPLWLLSKGKYDDGIESFRQFRGIGDDAEKELAAVLERTKARTANSSFKEIVNMVFGKPFMKSLVSIFFLFMAVQWCGINTISFYAQDIFQKTFNGDVDAFILMISTDCIRILVGISVCLSAKILPRKIIFITCCFLSTLVLTVLIVYLYLKPEGLVWVAVVCMVAYIAIASVFMSISWSFVAEIFPSQVRGLGSGLSSAISFILLFISVKVTPEIMTRYGEEVMYTIFGAVTLFAGICLSFILPDTNGKSLQEIEDAMYDRKDDQKDNNVSDNIPA